MIPKTFKAIDPETHQVAYTHSQEAFKRPSIEDGNLHWYGYASDQVIGKFGWNLDRILQGHFNEWCEDHGFVVNQIQIAIRKRRLEDYETTEFEFIAPIIKEGTLDAHSSRG